MFCYVVRVWFCIFYMDVVCKCRWEGRWVVVVVVVVGNCSSYRWVWWDFVVRKEDLLKLVYRLFCFVEWFVLGVD